jgi:hypothetical protein
MVVGSMSVRGDAPRNDDASRHAGEGASSAACTASGGSDMHPSLPALRTCMAFRRPRNRALNKKPLELPGAFDVGRTGLASEELVVEVHFEDMLVGTHVLKVGSDGRRKTKNTRAGCCEENVFGPLRKSRSPATLGLASEFVEVLQNSRAVFSPLGAISDGGGRV